MNHLTEEQFVLLYYGEATDAGDIEAHLAGCQDCRVAYRGLQTLLNTVDAVPLPERGPEYGPEVWGRIRKRLRRPRLLRWQQWWIWAPAFAALLVAAFLAGRFTHPTPLPATASGQVRQRILLVAVGEHLERSQMVLAELSNAPAGKGDIDISDERERAEELLDDNRLYRQTAGATGDGAVASVLDDLERVLLEIAHSPSEISGAQLDELRQEIRDRGLLFKVRVLGSRVREQENKPIPAGGKNSKNRL
jgi:hypothetical protein